jgi:hypothetical protein
MLCSFEDLHDKTFCDACAPGLHQGKDGAIQCEICSQGYFSLHGQARAPIGVHAQTDATLDTRTGARTPARSCSHSHSRSHSHSPAAFVQAKCTGCASGSYQPDPGATNCLPCSAVRLLDRSLLLSVSLPCHVYNSGSLQQGYFQPKTNQLACINCDDVGDFFQVLRAPLLR